MATEAPISASCTSCRTPIAITACRTPAYGFDHLEIADEPGVYEDVYRAWVRAQAPKQMDAISAGIPPATRVWQEALRIEDDIAHRGDSKGRFDFAGPIPFAADNNLTHSAFVGERTIEFIRQARDEPFLCIAGFYSPHAPWMVPQKYLDLYDPAALAIPAFPPEINRQRPRDPEALYSDAQLRRAKQGYYAMISEVDDYVGRILDALEECGKRDETIVVFTSDHGEWLGDHLRFGKGYPAPDVVSRVPLIIDAPGMPAGDFDGLVEAVDIMPTLLELAAIPQPSIMQGESLAGALRGRRRNTRQKESALTEGAGWKSLRTPQFQYLMHADGRECLWDLATDPGAYRDVAARGEYQSDLADCRKLLLTRLLAMERPLPRTWAY